MTAENKPEAVTRREFLKGIAVGAVATAAVSAGLVAVSWPAPPPAPGVVTKTETVTKTTKVTLPAPAPIDKIFLSDLYERFGRISREVSLTPEAKLLLSRDAQRLWLRNPDVSSIQLKNAIILAYGSAIIDAKKYGIATLDSIFAIKVYEEEIVPIITEVTGKEPPDDPPPESIPSAPPSTHMIDVKALNDPRVVKAILIRYPEIAVALI